MSKIANKKYNQIEKNIDCLDILLLQTIGERKNALLNSAILFSKPEPCPKCNRITAIGRSSSYYRDYYYCQNCEIFFRITLLNEKKYYDIRDLEFQPIQPAIESFHVPEITHAAEINDDQISADIFQANEIISLQLKRFKEQIKTEYMQEIWLPPIVFLKLHYPHLNPVIYDIALRYLDYFSKNEIGDEKT